MFTLNGWLIWLPGWVTDRLNEWTVYSLTLIYISHCFSYSTSSFKLTYNSLSLDDKLTFVQDIYYDNTDSWEYLLSMLVFTQHWTWTNLSLPTTNSNTYPLVSWTSHRRCHWIGLMCLLPPHLHHKDTDSGLGNISWMLPWMCLVWNLLLLLCAGPILDDLLLVLVRHLVSSLLGLLGQVVLVELSTQLLVETALSLTAPSGHLWTQQEHLTYTADIEPITWTGILHHN